jgi:hypothetical protein
VLLYRNEERWSGRSQFVMSLQKQQATSPAVAARDRRAHPRLEVQVQIELREIGRDVPYRLQTADLSKGGCYVQMMMTLPVGTRLKGTLWLDDVPVRVRARVVTSHPQFGNGIMFTEFEGSGKQVLERYLEGISL